MLMLVALAIVSWAVSALSGKCVMLVAVWLYGLRWLTHLLLTLDVNADDALVAFGKPRLCHVTLHKSHSNASHDAHHLCIRHVCQVIAYTCDNNQNTQ